jgi:type VI secretion system protein ImpK
VGGEKCFQLLGKLAENPSANRDLLELFHVCLALGFQGRYRALEGGAGQLAGVRERLWQMIARDAGARDPELSPHWKSDVSGRELKWHVPTWVIAGAAALAVGLLYVLLVLMLNATSDPVFAAIQNLKLKTAALPPEAPPPVPAAAPPPRLSGFLAPEIKADLVSVADLPDRSVVTIRGDGLFSPGSAEVDAKGLPILSRIAEALRATPGNVSIAGHSDSQPIRSARFPSNWHLSLARARSVQAYLGETVPAQRLRAEGKSDSEPVAGNDTPEGRARNRRVEITLFPVAGSESASTPEGAR